MQATDILEDEHRNIERMLTLIDKATEKLDQGQEVEPSFFEDAIDFIRNYADKKHHAKEETILFSVLSASGMPKETGPIAVMEEEHEKGRNLVKNLAEAAQKYRSGDANAKQELIHNGRSYFQMLSIHIKKEDNVLYPMANKMLNQQQLDDILKKFQETDAQFGAKEEHYQKMLKYWEQNL